MRYKRNKFFNRHAFAAIIGVLPRYPLQSEKEQIRLRACIDRGGYDTLREPTLSQERASQETQPDNSGKRRTRERVMLELV